MRFIVISRSLYIHRKIFTQADLNIGNNDRIPRNTVLFAVIYIVTGKMLFVLLIKFLFALAAFTVKNTTMLLT